MKEEKDMKNILAGTGRNIDEFGGFDIEIKPDRTQEDIFNNRPGKALREKIRRCVQYIFR